MDWNPLFDMHLQRSRYFVDSQGIIQKKPDWEDLRYDLERAFAGQMKNIDRVIERHGFDRVQEPLRPEA